MLPPGELPKYKNHYYYLSPREVMTHTEGNTECQELGGYLAEINDEEEYNFISNEVLNSLDYGYHNTRIGAKWSGTTDAGKWVYMTSGDDVTYIYTLPGTTLYQGEVWCLGLGQRYNSGSGRWDCPWYMGSYHCSNRYNLHNLCEIPAA